MSYRFYFHNPMVGERLRKLRKLKLLSLIQLSEITGISVAAISEIERGITIPRQSTVKKILKALNIEEELLYSNDDIKLTDLLPNNTTDRKIDDVNTQLQSLRNTIEQQNFENQKLNEEIEKLKNEQHTSKLIPTTTQATKYDFNSILGKWNERAQRYLMSIAIIDEEGTATEHFLIDALLKITQTIELDNKNNETPNLKTKK